MNQVIKIFILYFVTAPCLSAQNETGAEASGIILDRHGAIIRGDISKKHVALVFTGDTFADGATVIRTSLHRARVKASFFFTGNFYATFPEVVKSLKAQGHYLGAHSDKHLLYADWDKRDSTLVTEEEFIADLENNYVKMQQLGISKADAYYFIPPYEWYNAEIVNWTTGLNLRLINFSPGTRSTADYTHPGMGARYRSSDEIYKSILDFEANDPNGLNGFILLTHIGTDDRRTDKFYHKLSNLMTQLKNKGYQFVRIDELLK